MRGPSIGHTLLVFNAANELPNIEELIDAAVNAGATAVACLRFNTAHLERRTVELWVCKTSRSLAAARTHLITFNTDLQLALGMPLDPRSGLNPVAPYIWLVTRLWNPPCPPLPPAVTFVGPAELPRGSFAGSLWAHELLKPEDVQSVPRARTVIADIAVTGRELLEFRRSASARSAAEFHRDLGTAVLDRARQGVVWTAAQDDRMIGTRVDGGLIRLAARGVGIAPLKRWA